MPQDEKRRWVLSRMYNIAPALLGLSMIPPTEPKSTFWKPQPVDVKAYQKTLINYWKKGYKGTSEAALTDLGLRIRAIHEALPYSSEKDQLYRLLCGYLMRRSEIAREVGYGQEALDHLNKAILLATENHYVDLLATAFYRRGESYFHRWELDKALADFCQAEQFQQAPPDILGRIMGVKGATLARMARSDKEMAEAMRVVNQARPLIRTNAQEPSCLLDFPQGRFTANYIRALLGPPARKLHRPTEAEGLITGIYRKTVQPNHYAHEKIDDLLLSALISLDQGHHPVATTQLGDALQLIQKGRLFYLPFAEHIYEAILESPYGKEKEVAELGLQLLFVQMPHLLES